MAINLNSAFSAQVDFGDLASVAGLTAISFALVIKPSQFFDDDRLFSQWSGPAADAAFLCVIADTDELAFAFGDGTNRFGVKTTDLDLTPGSTYRTVITAVCGSPPVVHIYVNGVDKTLAPFVFSADVTQLVDSASAVQVGYETAESHQSADGDYAEFAIWPRVLTPAEADLFTLVGEYPPCCGPTGLLYLPMRDVTDLTDRWGQVTASQTAGSNATHPAMVSCLEVRAYEKIAARAVFVG